MDTSLGALRGRHTSATRRQSALALLGLALMLAAAGAAWSLSRSAPGAKDREGKQVVAVLFGGIGLAFVGLWWSRRGHAVEVREHGLLLVTRGRTRAVRWEEIDAVWQKIVRRHVNGVYVGTVHLYTLRLRGGEALTVSSIYRDMGALGDAIQFEHSRRALSTLARALDEGETVSFGAVATSAAGLTVRDRLVPWSRIGAATIDRGMLLVTEAGAAARPLLSVPAEVVPNLFALLALVRGRAAAS